MRAHDAIAHALTEWLLGRTWPGAPPQSAYPVLSGYLAAVGEHRPYPARQPGGGAFQYCGGFAAKCWREAGLRADVAPLWASTYKLCECYGKYRKDPGIPAPSAVSLGGQRVPLAVYHEAHGGARRVTKGGAPLADVRPGDVALVRTERPGSRPQPWGGHVTLVLDVLPDGSGVRTLSGNGRGWGPAKDGSGNPDRSKLVNGVVLNHVPWARVAWIVRPAPADCDPALVLV